MLPTDFQTFIALSRYARWLPDENRRETWEETVDRYITNIVIPAATMAGKTDTVQELRNAILNLEVMPSMRALMTAGPAAERDEMALYNCSFIAVDHPRAFDEVLYILTCGTGVGFSCEQKYVSQLPDVAESFHETDTTIVVGDSRIGWASSFRELIAMLYAGKIPRFDVSKVRPKGARLRTFGGRASGPQPLLDLFNYCIATFKNAAGRKLTDLEVHGIVCKIGEIVVVGGVRRSALISLSDLSSVRMRDAKAGMWWEKHPEFALANNSAVYEDVPTTGQFMEEWLSLYNSKSGERGIYYRKGIKDKTDAIGKRDSSKIVGTNPCGEIALRSAGLCNLSEIVVRADDTVADLLRKARLAAILGTIQSTYVNFRYVRPVWRRNAEEERLLGVSMTGIYDSPITNGSEGPEQLAGVLELVKAKVNETNAEWADALGINRSAATTCVKPSGTVSQLVNSASGIHPRHSSYYIRSVRGDNKDPMTAFLKAQGVPSEPCVMKPDTTTVFYFPVASPEAAVTREQITPTSHLDLWMVYNKHWAEHQVSVTVNVSENEWPRVGAWVYDNFDDLSGISFLPYDGGTYAQAPYQEISKEKYDIAVAAFPKDIDWSKLVEFEKEDTTTSSHELACVSGVCEII
jgi:ribonucleoside-diphosphate reductase alpha chain